MENKNLSYIETISSDIEVDIPSNPIEELNEISSEHTAFPGRTCETMNEQFVAIEGNHGR
jgi:hypothetical protein